MATDSLAPVQPTLRIGCAMWGLPEWTGTYFPATTKSGSELRQYAQWCTAVEGNTTFYGLPSKRAVDRWASAVGPEFRFVFKLPRAITHDQRLREVADLVREFCSVTEPLEQNLGPTSVQLPASFGPQDFGVLTSFLRRLPASRSWAVEVRHPAFFDGGGTERSLNERLHAFGMDRVILDSRAVFAGPRVTPAEIEAFENKPQLPVRATATSQSPIVRFIGQTRAEANPDFWHKWVAPVVRWLDQGREPIVFIHTPDNAVAIGLARRFYSEVAKSRPSLPALPEPESSEQAALFEGSSGG